MIKRLRYKGIERFFRTGSKAAITTTHAVRLRAQLTTLDAATKPEDMNLPGWQWHPLEGVLAGHWGVTVNKRCRLTYTFKNGDAVLVDYQDYH